MTAALADVPAAVEATDEIHVIAIIDDAFDELTPDNLVGGGAEEIAEAILGREELLASLEALGLECRGPADITSNFLESVARPDSPKGELYAVVLSQCPRLDERRDMLTLVRRLESLGVNVVTVRPKEEPDLQECQVVFLDYYLEGSESTNGCQLAMHHAARIARTGGDTAPVLALMSSRSGVRALKDEFRTQAGVNAWNFVFIAKRDLDELWTLRAHLKMLAGARPRAARIAAYASGLMDAIDLAKNDLKKLMESLEIADYSYLHHIALFEDGGPLGEYLSWLFSAHFLSLVFERELRPAQHAVDRVMFQSVLMTPSAPSLGVGELYHSVQFERNIGPLAGHPHDDAGAVSMPVLRLGDVFISEHNRRAYVILSAECDLAFGVVKRPPDQERSVIIVPGMLRDVRTLAVRAGGARTDFYQTGENTYDIEWDLKRYVTKALREVRFFLTDKECDLEHRARLRPLYALKLQEEFATSVLRIGLPVAPPIFRSATTEVWYRIGDDATRLARLTTAESVVYLGEKVHHAVASLEVAVAIRAAVGAGIERLENAIKESEEAGQDAKGNVLKRLRSELERFIELHNDEGFWAGLVEKPQPLPQSGTKSLSRNVLFVVVDRGDDARVDALSDEVGQGKSCVVWRLLDVDE